MARIRKPSERFYLRSDVKGSKRRCATPGCPKQTQTEDPRCHWCREGRKGHLVAEVAA
jgi:hypothetical protein